MQLTDTPSAELAVLGAVIASGGSILDETDLQPEDFADPARGEVFRLMRQMHERGQTVDQVTVSAALPDHAAFVWSLTDHTPFASAFHEYAGIVAANGLYLRFLGVSASLRAIGPDLGVDAMIERANELIDGASSTTRRKVRFIRDILPGTLDKLSTRQSFTPTPWPTLDDVIGGLRPGAVYVVAARPGVGKTVIAAQLACKLAESGFVSFSSLEMSEDELLARLLSERLSIPVGRIKDSRLNAADWARIEEYKTRLNGLKIAIDDRASVSPSDIRGHARSVSRNGKLAGIVVDYLQLMASTNGRQDRHVQVADFSRQLKIMAKDFKVPVIALSQLNRESEARTDKRPRLSDLRESGAIEQDADVVILLSKEDYNGEPAIHLDVAKNRHGVMGETVVLRWQGEYSRAVSW